MDAFLARIERARQQLFWGTAAATSAIALADWYVGTEASIAALYVLPMMTAAMVIGRLPLVVFGLFCSALREAFYGSLSWVPGWEMRVVTAGFALAMVGLVVHEGLRNRRVHLRHIAELRAEVERREAVERRLVSLVETTPIAVMLLDAQGSVQLANSSAHELLAGSDGNVTGESVRDFLPTLHALLQQKSGSAAFRAALECVGTRSSGEAFLANVWAARDVNSDQSVAIVWDSSEEFRVRGDASFEAAMKTSHLLLRSVSHEVRNVAAGALAALEALASNARIRETLEFRTLGRLLDALEDLASTGLRKSHSIEGEPVDLRLLLGELRVIIDPQFRAIDADMIWEIPGVVPLVNATHQGVLQILLNLTRNAERALLKVERRRLRVSLAALDGHVNVWVYDSGPGIPNPERLFRPLDPAADSNGLGLYLSREIARSFGGELSYEARDGGSCFNVRLTTVNS